MFSATGSLLTGTERRPDIYTVHTRDNDIYNSYDAVNSAGAWSKLNICGYVPIVSTITGLGRFLLGIVHTIVHLVSAIFDAKNTSEHLKEAKLGAINIGRGFIESIPLTGNIIMIMTDIIRSSIFAEKAKESINSSPAYIGQALLFGNGVEIARRDLKEYKQVLDSLSPIRKVSIQDKIKIIQNNL